MTKQAIPVPEEESLRPVKPVPALRGLKLLLTIIYLSLLTYIVFFARRRRSIHRRYLNLVPVKKTIHEYSQIGAELGGRWNFYTNLLGNVLLFIPLSIVLMNYGRTEKVKRVVLTCFIISCCIEILQYVFEIGFSDIDDVILNTSGSIIGAYIFLFLRKKGWVQLD